MKGPRLLFDDLDPLAVRRVETCVARLARRIARKPHHRTCEVLLWLLLLLWLLWRGVVVATSPHLRARVYSPLLLWWWTRGELRFDCVAAMVRRPPRVTRSGGIWLLRGSACVVARVERYGLAELGVAVEVECGGLHPCVIRVTRVVDVPVLSHYES